MNTFPVTLYDWAPSPFCHKVRAALEFKRIAYRTLPALSHVRSIRRRGGVGKVPAIELDGRFVVDSTDILLALEARSPEPSLVPLDTRAAALCHALEDWADESLYFFGLYYHWHEPQGRAQVAAYFARTWFGRVAFLPYLLRIERQLRGHGMLRKTPEHVRRDLERNLDAIEGLLAERTYLVDDAPRLCDLAVMAQLVYLSRTPGNADVLTRRPRLGEYVSAVPGSKR